MPLKRNWHKAHGSATSHSDTTSLMFKIQMYLKQQSILNLGFQVSLITETWAPLSNWLSEAEPSKAHLSGSFPSSFRLFLCHWGFFGGVLLGVFLTGHSGFEIYCSLHSRQFEGRGPSCCFEQMGSSSLETGSVQP